MARRKELLIPDALLEYPSGEGRGRSSFWRLAALVFLEDEAHFLDPVIGEGEHPVVVEAVDPDHAILGFQAEGEIMDAVLIYAQSAGNVGDGVDVMNLVALRVHAAADSGLGSGGFQFHGSNASSR